MKDTPIIIGEITGIYGIKGWVKVFSHTEPRLNIVKYNPWLVQQNNSWLPMKLTTGRTQGKTIVAQLEGVTSPEQARAMIGSKVAILNTQLKKLANNDFYWRELEGLEVVNIKGESLGKISHLIETGANDVMVITLPPEKARNLKIKELMIPYLMDKVVKKVNLDTNIIEVDWDHDY